MCGHPTCVICALTSEQIERIWLACKSIDNREFCQEFARALLSEAVAVTSGVAAHSETSAQNCNETVGKDRANTGEQQ